MPRRYVLLVALLFGQLGVAALAFVVIPRGATHVDAAGNHNIAVGPGFTDVSPHQLVRTSTNILYTVAPTCDSYPSCPNNTLRVYAANQPGTPTAFTELDAGHEPTNVGSSAIAIDGTDTLHVLWNDRAGTLNYRTFSTTSNLWSGTTAIATTNWTDFGQGDEGVALAVDSAGMPHAVWSAKGSDGILHVFYGNRGGNWSAQQVDDIPLSNNRRALHPTIAFSATNALVVAWLEGTFNYVPDGIIRVRTRTTAGTWSATQTINDAAMTTIDNGPSLLIAPDGTIHLAFLNTNDETRYWYNSGSGWQGDQQPPTQQTHNPSLGPDGNGGVSIYGHGTPVGALDGHGDNLYFFHKAAGGAWEPWTLYVTGAYDSSVSTRWAQFFQAFPQTLDIAYWVDAYPNMLYIGTDNPAGGTATPIPTVTATATGTPVSTPTPTIAPTATLTPVPTNTATPTPTPGGSVLIGTTAIGNELDYNQPGTANAFQYSASASGTVSTLTVYLDASSTASTLVAGLYTDSGGQPGALLTQGTLASPVKGAWNRVSVPAVNVTAGTLYWLAVMGPVGGGTLWYWQIQNGGPAIVSTNTTLSQLPGTWTSGQRYGASPLSAYAATSGGTPTPTPTPVLPTATPTPTALPTATATSTPPPGSTALIGSTTIGNQQDDVLPGTANAFQLTATAGTVNSLAIYLDPTNTATTVVLGMYSDTGGNPGTLLTQGTISAPTNGAWNRVAVPSVTLVGGRSYWLVVLTPQGGGTIQFWDRANGGTAIVSAQTTLTSLPTTWQSGARYPGSPPSAYGASG